MKRSATRLFPVWLGVWTSTALTCAVLLVASEHAARAGINVWTTHGPYGETVYALAIDPRTPSILYAGTGAGVFSIQIQQGAVCVGDCDGSGDVKVDELLTLVNIALGNADVSACMAGDANKDRQITIDEILTAVHNALTGCADAPTVNTTGEWSGNWASNTEGHGSLLVAAQFQQNGALVTGEVTVTGSPCISTGHVSATVTGKSVTGSVLGDNGYTLGFTGTVDGNSLNGTYNDSNAGCGPDDGTFSMIRNTVDVVLLVGSPGAARFRVGADPAACGGAFGIRAVNADHRLNALEFETPHSFVLAGAGAPISAAFQAETGPLTVSLSVGSDSLAGTVNIPTGECRAISTGAPDPLGVGQEVRFEIISESAVAPNIRFAASVGDVTATHVPNCRISGPEGVIAENCQTPATFFLEDARHAVDAVFSKLPDEPATAEWRVDLYVGGVLTTSVAGTGQLVVHHDL